MNVNLFNINTQEVGERLDKMLANRMPDYSRMQIQEFIKDGLVRVNGRASKPSYRLEADDEIEIDAPPPKVHSTEIQPEAIPLEVLYEDEYLAVINKPAGLVVHIGHGNEQGTLVNALLARWEQVAEVGDIRRAGIVHRLDKDTSGVLLIALTEPIQRKLQAQFQARTVEKIYWALVEGQPRTEIGKIDVPIGRHPQERKKMAVLKEGRPSVTYFEILERYEKHSLVELKIETGRTHQIRVHLAFIGNPVVGDETYGFRKQTISMKRLFLHAKTLSFDHPVTGKRMTIDTELPEELQKILEKLPR